MNGILLQTESHQNSLDTQNLFEGRNNWNTSTPTYSQRFLPESDAYSLLGCSVSRHINRANISFASMLRRNFHFYIVGCYLIYIVLEQF